MEPDTSDQALCAYFLAFQRIPADRTPLLALFHSDPNGPHDSRGFASWPERSVNKGLEGVD